jgi:hypothetical protein
MLSRLARTGAIAVVVMLASGAVASADPTTTPRRSCGPP